uniref:Uncharacterized protein n=1 Tax=Solanum tuberosum TaxID=4113 RepID=M1C3D8_SOLTU
MALFIAKKRFEFKIAVFAGDERLIGDNGRENQQEENIPLKIWVRCDISRSTSDLGEISLSRSQQILFRGL